MKSFSQKLKTKEMTFNLWLSGHSFLPVGNLSLNFFIALALFLIQITTFASNLSDSIYCTATGYDNVNDRHFESSLCTLSSFFVEVINWGVFSSFHVPSTLLNRSTMILNFEKYWESS